MSESLHTKQMMKIMQSKAGHECCYHMYHGSILMVVPDGHIVQKCCKCACIRTTHADHLGENDCNSVDISWR